MQYLKGIIIGILALIMVCVVSSQITNDNKLGGVFRVPTYTSVTTSQVTANLEPATSTVVLTAKGGRGYASICNATNDAGYIQLGNTATTSTAYGSIRIPAYGCYEITQDNLYTGEIRYVPVAATTTLQVVEFIGY